MENRSSLHERQCLEVEFHTAGLKSVPAAGLQQSETVHAVTICAGCFPNFTQRNVLAMVSKHHRQACGSAFDSRELPDYRNLPGTGVGLQCLKGRKTIDQRACA